MVDIWQSNTSPSLTDTIKVNGVAFDLTSATVKLQMRLVTAAATDPLKIDAAAVIVTPLAGTVRYDWATSDVNTAGEYVAWWHVTLPSTKVQDSDEFAINVRAHGIQTGNLCSLADVRASLEMNPQETTRDELILSLIPVASQMLSNYCEREFAPVSTALTRRFKITGGIVSLSPYDLQTATVVSLNPETSSPQTLVAGSDYTLTPVTSGEGVYMTVRLSAFLNVFSNTMIQFGYALLDVTGTWGFPSIPAVVNEACSDAVAAWMRRDVSAFGLQLQDGMALQPDFATSFDLPIGAIRKVNGYRRSISVF